MTMVGWLALALFLRLESIGLVEEVERTSFFGDAPYYVIRVIDDAKLPDIGQFDEYIQLMADSDSVVLEVAATYDAFREQGDDHEQCKGSAKKRAISAMKDGRRKLSVC